jgi:hypothetical protein
VDWFHVAQDREKWRTFLNALMNPLVPQNAENKPFASQEGLCVMDLVS